MNFAESLVWASVAADLVMQSFRHTAAYPKPVHVVTHHTLPTLFEPVEVCLRPGDGIFHSWVNRMLIPDTVSARGAGSGLVAFARPLE